MKHHDYFPYAKSILLHGAVMIGAEIKQVNIREIQAMVPFPIERRRHEFLDTWLLVCPKIQVEHHKKEKRGITITRSLSFHTA